MIKCGACTIHIIIFQEKIAESMMYDKMKSRKHPSVIITSQASGWLTLILADLVWASLSSDGSEDLSPVSHGNGIKAILLRK